MRIEVIGTGYVWLVTGTCFERGNTVTCVETNKQKIENLNNGVIPTYERGLDTFFMGNRKEGRLSFTTALATGIADAKIIFLALPTISGEDGSADLKYILNVAEELGPLLIDYTVIVDKSTVSVGTSIKFSDRIRKHSKVDFDIVSNSEFLHQSVAHHHPSI